MSDIYIVFLYRLWWLGLIYKSFFYGYKKIAILRWWGGHKEGREGVHFCVSVCLLCGCVCASVFSIGLHIVLLYVWYRCWSYYRWCLIQKTRIESLGDECHHAAGQRDTGQDVPDHLRLRTQQQSRADWGRFNAFHGSDRRWSYHRYNDWSTYCLIVFLI